LIPLATLLLGLQDPVAPARALLEEGRFAAAASALEPPGVNEGAPPDSLALLAEAWVALGLLDRAEPLLARLSTESSPSPEALVSLAERLASAGRIGRAGVLLDSALARRPDDPVLLLAAARQRYGLGKPDQVLEFLARPGAPSGSGAEYLRGASLRALGREAEAETALRRAVAAEPRHAPSQEELGHLLEGKGDLEGALRSFEAALAADADRPGAAGGRARLLARLGRREEADLAFLRFRVIHAFEEARKDHETSAREHPEEADAWLALGDFLLENRQVRKSLPPLRRALELAPDDARALESLARARASVGEFGESERIYGDLRRRFPDRGDLALRLAEVREERGAPEGEVARLLEDSARLGCREAALDLALGRADLRAGRPEEALRRFREAARREAGNAEAWRTVGFALESLGRNDEAERELRTALERDPSNPAPRPALIRLLEGRGRSPEVARERALYERQVLESRLRSVRR
jgi:tetratricopeptide (TPR) repeat protein